MRLILGLLSLLLVLFIVSQLAKTQVGVLPGKPSGEAVAPSAQPSPQKVKEEVEKMMQPPAGRGEPPP